MAWVAAVAQVQSLAWELLHAVGTDLKKKKREREKKAIPPRILRE